MTIFRAFPLAVILTASPALSQTMDHAEHGAPAAQDDCAPEHAAMGHCTPKTTPQHEAAPPADQANYADRIWGAEAMAPIRARMMREHGGMAFSQVMLNRAEIRAQKGRDAYVWDGEAWFGGDIHRIVLKSEGDGALGGRFGDAEFQALYARAIGPYFNLQAGARQDVGLGASRTYATLGFEGLAPYWFDVEGALFLSAKGDVLARLDGYYDQRITQRLVLQPRVELNLAAQDRRTDGIGAGLTDAELGLRLRYELRREFAPYVGVTWERKLGATARLARNAGEDAGGWGIVLGLRTWF